MTQAEGLGRLLHGSSGRRAERVSEGPNINVSPHAALRFLERVEGYAITHLGNDLETWAQVRAATGLTLDGVARRMPCGVLSQAVACGFRALVVSGVRYVLAGDVVVTVIVQVHEKRRVAIKERRRAGRGRMQRGDDQDA